MSTSMSMVSYSVTLKMHVHEWIEHHSKYEWVQFLLTWLTHNTSRFLSTTDFFHRCPWSSSNTLKFKIFLTLQETNQFVILMKGLSGNAVLEMESWYHLPFGRVTLLKFTCQVEFSLAQKDVFPKTTSIMIHKPDIFFAIS